MACASNQIKEMGPFFQAEQTSTVINKEFKIRKAKNYKIGIIEIDSLNESLPQYNELKIKYFHKERFDKNRNHPDVVASALLREIEDKNKIELYSCSLNLNAIDYSINECLKWFLKEEVSFINMSLVMDIISKQTVDSLKMLLDTGAIMAVAAGNSGQLAQKEQVYCSLYNLNIACVGALRDNVMASYSNFGSLINVLEDGDIEYEDFDGHKFYYYGTSYASPRFLGKVINKMMKNSHLEMKGKRL